MQTINKLSKGCGKRLSGNYGSNSNERGCGKRRLCPTCQALLQQSKEIIIKVNKFFSKFEKLVEINNREGILVVTTGINEEFVAIQEYFDLKNKFKSSIIGEGK